MRHWAERFHRESVVGFLVDDNNTDRGVHGVLSFETHGFYLKDHCPHVSPPILDA